MNPISLVLASLILSLAVPRSAPADAAAEQLVLATYKLAGEGSTATGLSVFDQDEDGTRRWIISANHVFKQMKGDAFKLISRKKNDNGTYSRNEIDVPLRKDGKALWKKHDREDLAVLPLPEDIEIEALPITCLVTEKQIVDGVHTGDDIHAAVFPERSEANGAGFPLLRGGSIAGFPLKPIKHHPLYLVHTSTWPGDSGGPVMHKTLRAPSGGPLVIGFVRGMRSITDKEKTSRYVESTTSYPLDIAEVLHATLVRELLP
jgi:hypothetical protein